MCRKLFVYYFTCFILVCSSCGKDDIETDSTILRIEGPECLNAPNERDLLDPIQFLSRYWVVENGAETLSYFRTTNDDFVFPDDDNCPPHFNPSYTPSKEGLSELRMSGSGEFSPSTIDELIRRIRKVHNGEITIVDLRSETHGYLNNRCVYTWSLRNWCNIGKTADVVQNEERAKLYSLIGKEVFVHQTAQDSIKWEITAALTEKDLCSHKGLYYIRIPALDYAPFPSDYLIERFVSIVKNIRRDTWIHFHCAQGIGRTSLFMVLFDMMRNPDLSIDDIIYRQYLIGGAFLFDDMEDYPKKWVHELASERIVLLPIFYQYVKQCYRNNFSLSWSDWKRMALIYN